jgi:hypothetical protein
MNKKLQEALDHVRSTFPSLSGVADDLSVGTVPDTDDEDNVDYRAKYRQAMEQIADLQSMVVVLSNRVKELASTETPLTDEQLSSHKEDLDKNMTSYSDDELRILYSRHYFTTLPKNIRQATAQVLVSQAERRKMKTSSLWEQISITGDVQNESL